METRINYRPSARRPARSSAGPLTWLLALLVAVAAGTAFAQSQQKQEPIVVIGKEYSFTGPAQMAPGWHCQQHRS